ncbi:hypothetical protein FRC02_008686 [Tulasnella sp. 418]|nr:hypothetical protein FRC02_008686 [Tulasnella sp. 418]
MEEQVAEEMFKTIVDRVNEASNVPGIISHKPTRLQLNPKAIERQTEILNHLLKKIHAKLADIAQHRNSTGLAFRIPVEIWDMIIGYSTPQEAKSHIRARHLNNCSATCRQWRHIIRHSPWLWPFLVDIPNFKFAQEMLDRSKQSHLYLSYSSWIPRKISDLVLPHFRRVHHLDVVAGVRETKNLFECLCTPDATPNLEVFCVTNPDPNGHVTIKGLKRVTARRLRRLEIPTISIPLRTFTVTSPLTHLHLRVPYSSPLPHYHRLLIQLKTLEVLHLTSQEHRMDQGQTQPIKAISSIILPCLRQLTLEDLPGPIVMGLLHHIDNHSCQSIRVTTNPLQPDLDLKFDVWTLREDTALARLLAAPKSLHISRRCSNTLSIDASQDKVVSDHELRKSPEGLHIMVKRHRYEAAPIISVLNRTNLSQLRILKLFGVKLSDALSNHLWVMENLKQLHIHNGGNVDRLFDVLGERLPSNAWPCRKLIILAISDGTTFSQSCLLKMVRGRYDRKGSRQLPSTMAGPIAVLDVECPLNVLDQYAMGEIVRIIGTSFQCHLIEA